MPRTLWSRGLAACGDWLSSPSAEAVVAYTRAGYDEWGWADPVVELALYERRGEAVPPVPGMSGDELARQMLVVRHRERGYYFEDSERPGRWLAAIDPAGSRDEWVPCRSHGEEAFFLAACFLPLAVSARVATDFVATQEPSAAVEWVPSESSPPGAISRPAAGSADAAPGAAADRGRRVGFQELVSRSRGPGG